MIRHAALFALTHAADSPEERLFLAALAELRRIPGVQDLTIMREISPKNAFDFVVSMSFADQAAYESYNLHPLHRAFVQDRWIPEVATFMEHDSVPLG